MTKLPFSKQALVTHHRDTLNTLFDEYGHTPPALITLLGQGLFLEDKTLFNKAVKQILSYVKHAEEITNSDGEVLKNLVKQAPELTPENIITERTVEDKWILQFNQIRAARPKRDAAKAVKQIKEPFNPDGFNFNKVPNEEYFRGVFDRLDVAFYFNKFPFSYMHTSIVPDPTGNHPQYLTRIYHDLAWHLSQELDTEDNPIIAYNAHGAYASINHMHFQLTFNMDLPVLDKRWRQNGGSENYPIDVRRFDNLNDSWSFINILHDLNQPYNVLYVNGTVYVMVRAFQGASETPKWNTGFGWLEVGGLFILIDKEAFAVLDEETINKALARVSVTV